MKGLIFDMDGTITITEQLHFQAFSQVFQSRGVNDFTLEEELRNYAGVGSKGIFEDVFKKRGVQISPEEIEKCVTEKRELYTKIVQAAEIPIVPGIKEFAKKIHEQGFKMIIATGNSNLDAVRLILKKAGLDAYFSQIISVSEVSRGKPFPDVFLEAAKRIGYEPLQCVVFEDALNGVMAAKAAGMACIALETGTSEKELRAAGADWVVKNYDEIQFEILNSKS